MHEVGISFYQMTSIQNSYLSIFTNKKRDGMIQLKDSKSSKLTSKPQTFSSTIHHTYKLKLTDQEQKTKIYFARLRGYRDRS